MRRFLVVLLVAILITALWYFFAVGPINERADTARTELETAQTEEFVLQTTLSRLRKIEENQLEYATAIGQLQTAVPPTPRLAELIDDLNFLADENGLEWASGSFATPVLVEGSDVYEVGFAVVVNGQFFEILGYLYGLADLDRVVRIDSVALSPSSDEAGFHNMSASLDGVAFTTGDVSFPVDLASLLPTEEETTDDTTGGEESDTSTTTIPTSTTVPTTTTTEGG
jgi:Tfp pilus assembly protein PilO